MIESTVAKFLAGIIAVAALTTIFGRSSSAAVFDSLGNAGSSLISASLGKGAGVK
jgi:hypothetical protein